jgi:hypothetical protein|tara:strand:+ start:340 stop:489 length:150 start_codon:yes stop_codon:yes gene_type:complete
MEDNIQSNTCEIIKIDRKTITDIKDLKKEYLLKKEKIKKEILNELKDSR